MKRGAASKLAWSIGTSAIALMIGSLVLAYLDRHTRLPDGAASQAWNVSNVLNAVVNIAVPSIGILLGSRRPENPLGRVFLTAGSMIGLSEFGLAYGVHALVAHHGSLPAGRALAWVGSAVGVIPLGMLAFLLLLFPTGHVRNRRWRPAAAVGGRRHRRGHGGLVRLRHAGLE